MTHDSNGNFIPRPPRFAVTDASEVRVTVTRTEEGDHETFDATLVDVSQHGTKLRVPMHFRFEETLQLKIEIENSELEYHGVASVRHIRSADPTQKQTEYILSWRALGFEAPIIARATSCGPTPFIGSPVM